MFDNYVSTQVKKKIKSKENLQLNKINGRFF